MVTPMDVESRDSVSLKPAELDELGQLVSGLGLPLQDEQLDTPRRAVPAGGQSSAIEGEIQGFLFGSLERIGGTPCILWGLGGVRRGRTPDRASTASSPSCTAGRRSRSPTRTSSSRGGSRTRPRTRCSAVLDDVCPRPKYSPNGEERAWGRRLARRFGCDARYDDRSVPPAAPTARPSWCSTPAAVKAGGKVVVELVGEVDPANGEALIAYGWAMAEALADGLATPRS